ncbi:MAG: hypothetical protein ACW98Y_21920 [Candidatus Thorarchaeota archaeon]|jgi:hypothetical protein
MNLQEMKTPLGFTKVMAVILVLSSLFIYVIFDLHTYFLVSSIFLITLALRNLTGAYVTKNP